MIRRIETEVSNLARVRSTGSYCSSSMIRRIETKHRENRASLPKLLLFIIHDKKDWNKITPISKTRTANAYCSSSMIRRIETIFALCIIIKLFTSYCSSSMIRRIETDLMPKWWLNQFGLLFIIHDKKDWNGTPDEMIDEDEALTVHHPW